MSVLILTGLLTSLLTVLNPAPAAHADRQHTAIRGHLTDHRTSIGKPVRIAGRVSGTKRRLVRAQVRVKGRWRTVDTDRTNDRRRFRLRTRAWYGVHRYRILAPATEDEQRAIRHVGKLRVRPGYRAKGRAQHHSFLAGRDRHWNACQSIRWRWNPRGSYPGALRDMRRALRTLAKASGLRFSHQGRTGKVSYRGNKFTDPGRTADLIITWARPAQVPGLRGRAVGLGGFSYYGNEIAQGNVALDASASHKHSRALWRQVMLHEVGHVIGLGHTGRRDQVMHGTAHRGNRRFGTGDLTGVRHMGAAVRCHSDNHRTARTGRRADHRPDGWVIRR